ncbi:LPXTG cell wall anchor domain-containing protein [Rathayibacter festucae]|uniref:LPXTG cell wall anchor domain-containing protein n=1 Tax=Rathayibacter festucae TaxID=110937 RepID=A0ABX6GVV7_9MICO|nr:LPXTG cell wall anchor domain-containing protein [Rathayibacter festucae]QHC61565.1 LPXTG cell wall anchor domain-containing protein [Rathayibacter festucae]
MHRRPDSLRPRRCAGTPFTVAASLALTVGLLGSATAAHAAVVPTATPTPTASATVKGAAFTATAVGELVLQPGEKPKVGTVVKWTVTFTNTGDVPLTGIAPLLVQGGIALAPGQTREVAATDTLDQNDLTNGYVDLKTFVSGTTPDGAKVDADLTARLSLPGATPAPTPTTPAPTPTTPAPTPTTPAPAPTPARGASLSATARGELLLEPGEKPEVGTQVKWTITITNTGDVPLTKVASALTQGGFDLQPGETRDLTVLADVLERDLANGYMAVDLPVAGVTPEGASVGTPLVGRLDLRTPTPAPTPTTPAPTPTTPAPTPTTPAPAPTPKQGPALTATARGELVLKPGEKPKVGTEVKWTITITNTGDVPLDDFDPAFGPGLRLEPGQGRESVVSTPLDQKQLADGYAYFDRFIGADTPDHRRVFAPVNARLALPGTTPTPTPTTPAPTPTTPAPTPAPTASPTPAGPAPATPTPAPVTPGTAPATGTPAAVVPATAGPTGLAGSTGSAAKSSTATSSTAAEASKRRLAETGSDAAGVLSAAGILTALGAIGVLVGRRRRRTRPATDRTGH